MGVSHSMNKAQMDSVLDQFEATTGAVRGIERKAARASAIIDETHQQQEALHRQADRANLFVTNLTDTLNRRSEQVLHLRTALENIVDLVERLEIAIYDLGLKDLPGQIQREFGPLLMPALVLTLIVTVSNCCFGFLLATDNELAASILDAGTMNVLNIFAIFHVVLIGVACLYLLAEGVLMCVKSHRQQRTREAAGHKEPEGLQYEEQEQRDSRDSGTLSDVSEEEPPPAMTMRRSYSDPVISICTELPAGSLSAGPGRAFCPRDRRRTPQSQSSQEEAPMKPCASDYSMIHSLRSSGVVTSQSSKSSPRPLVRSAGPVLAATAAGGTGRAHSKNAIGAAHKVGAVSQMLRTALQSAQDGTSSMASPTDAAGFRAFVAMKTDTIGRQHTTESTEQMAQARAAGGDRDKKLMSTPGEGEGCDRADGEADPSGSSSASRCRDGSSPRSQAYRRGSSTMSV